MFGQVFDFSNNIFIVCISALHVGVPIQMYRDASQCTYISNPWNTYIFDLHDTTHGMIILICHTMCVSMGNSTIYSFHSAKLYLKNLRQDTDFL